MHALIKRRHPKLLHVQAINVGHVLPRAKERGILGIPKYLLCDWVVHALSHRSIRGQILGLVLLGLLLAHLVSLPLLALTIGSVERLIHGLHVFC